MPFKGTHNVKAIKGFVSKNIWSGSFSSLSVSWDGQVLKDGQRLTDFNFVQQSFIVTNLALEEKEDEAGEEKEGEDK